ncbi:hypothetical protein [Chelatococcus asaccharovorans]|uniref:C2H2-type domain-containing protein n=1 Tax=Chelatococcus asaccharovorans TaxID=28210 RepID=A0A2V3UDN5_9HYPH|nr:hypothetical protein [Chelatococcus asaccharovorans]MBS7703284.1 hypothetical protein [Chelatococcus asaccharovorans]PXW61616.1 hypothetical protein C7450_103133 [Chelatococcus asaccharovorans]
MKDRRFMCGACHKRFTTIQAVKQHAATHKRALIEIFERVGRAPADDEPSIASRVIDAELDRAMGLPIDPDVEGYLL